MNTKTPMKYRVVGGKNPKTGEPIKRPGRARARPSHFQFSRHSLRSACLRRLLRPLRGSGFALGQPDAFGAGASPHGSQTPARGGYVPHSPFPKSPRRWPRAFANSSSFCFIFFPFFPYGKFAFVKMNLFSATFELVLSERRTCSQQAENLFKFRRDPPVPSSRFPAPRSQFPVPSSPFHKFICQRTLITPKGLGRFGKARVFFLPLCLAKHMSPLSLKGAFLAYRQRFFPNFFNFLS